MSKILITGCSSGFGLDAAKFFLDRGWDVVATMRKPNDELLPKSDRLCILPLDVTDAASISQAIADAGAIDAAIVSIGHALQVHHFLMIGTIIVHYGQQRDAVVCAGP